MAELTRRAAGDPFPGRVVHGEELTRFTGGRARSPTRPHTRHRPRPTASSPDADPRGVVGSGGFVHPPDPGGATQLRTPARLRVRISPEIAVLCH